MNLPIGRTREGRYLLVFTVQFLLALGLSGWYEVSDGLAEGILGTILAIGDRMSRLSILIAVNTVLAVEGGAMLAERYLRRRYRAGREEGRAEERARWEAWYRMLQKAEQVSEAAPPPPPPMVLPVEDKDSDL